eukprot:CAMPEP_0182802822 /NCGR_PEP_ID=MMETSP0006_2-20121128/3684_1 /TAXON_ID=97485 /ORGANISM="Prymnesium parvum, Strain Texoma1" /LENGTH=55 /DNA_ID=CAMNT_0024928223 /DNA_START=685 /DNA_END=852 /DNA_ORIENTATION=+
MAFALLHKGQLTALACEDLLLLPAHHDPEGVAFRQQARRDLAVGVHRSSQKRKLS